jgi:hypothetical protein
MRFLSLLKFHFAFLRLGVCQELISNSNNQMRERGRWPPYFMWTLLISMKRSIISCEPCWFQWKNLFLQLGLCSPSLVCEVLILGTGSHFFGFVFLTGSHRRLSSLPPAPIDFPAQYFGVPPVSHSEQARGQVIFPSPFRAQKSSSRFRFQQLRSDSFSQRQDSFSAARSSVDFPVFYGWILGKCAAVFLWSLSMPCVPDLGPEPLFVRLPPTPDSVSIHAAAGAGPWF